MKALIAGLAALWATGANAGPWTYETVRDELRGAAQNAAIIEDTKASGNALMVIDYGPLKHTAAISAGAYKLVWCKGSGRSQYVSAKFGDGSILNFSCAGGGRSLLIQDSTRFLSELARANRVVVEVKADPSSSSQMVFEYEPLDLSRLPGGGRAANP